MASGAPAMEHVGKDTYFRDHHLFLTRAKELVISTGSNGHSVDELDRRCSSMVDRRAVRCEETSGTNQDELAEWTTLMHARFIEVRAGELRRPRPDETLSQML